MLGKRHAPELKTKAAETLGLLPFAVELLERFEASLGTMEARFLLASGRAALEVNNIIRDGQRVLSASSQEALMQAYLRHVCMFKRGGGALTPKHHLMFHLVQKTFERGNPKYYHCYRDESLNDIVGKIASTAHRLTFAETVHRKFNVLQALQPKMLGMF